MTRSSTPSPSRSPTAGADVKVYHANRAVRSPHAGPSQVSGAPVFPVWTLTLHTEATATSSDPLPSRSAITGDCRSPPYASLLPSFAFVGMTDHFGVGLVASQ